MMRVVIGDWGKWKVAWISPTNLARVAALVKSGKVDGVGINSYNQEGADICLLAQLPSLGGLVVTDVKKMDISPILNMPHLRFLTLGEKRSQSIDFSRFKNLEDLRINVHARDILPKENQKLREILLAGYMPKSRNLSMLAGLSSLEYLELVQANIVSVDGIGKQSGLEELQLHYCRSLRSLSALAKTKVKRLHFSGCSGVESFEVLKDCPDLRSIRMSSCGILPSLKFLNDCEKLEEFRFVTTTIADNDMTPLLRLQSVGFMNRRGYSHTNEQVKAEIEKRTGIKQINY